MNTKTCLLGAGSVLLATAIPYQSFAAEQDSGGEAAHGKPGCFYARNANDFDALDDRNLIIYAPGKSRAYHVQITPRSTELRFANGIAFVARGGRICGYSGESVSFGRRGGGGARRYSVTNVWHVDEGQIEQLKIQYKSPRDVTPVEPKETEGAEVERDLSGDEEREEHE